MKIRVPEYFVNFKCIADKCKDSCCIGWEIDIDSESAKKYTMLDCEIGREIAEKTQHGYFPLENNGRCAFLDCHGLCRIISALGEEYLCDICREHPRYYGIGKYGIEGGLGLGCEEAARMILTLNKLPRIVEIEREIHYLDEDDFKDVSALFQERLFDSIFKFDIPELTGIYTAYAKVADDVVFDVCSSGSAAPIPKPIVSLPTEDEISDLLEQMMVILFEAEALNDEWKKLIELAKSVDIHTIINRANSSKGLLYYFTHRYVREGVEDMSLPTRILFAFLSLLAVSAIAEVLDTDEKIVRAAVIFSKNIEYSTQNVDIILGYLSDIL